MTANAHSRTFSLRRYLDDSECRGAGRPRTKPTVTLSVPDPDHINSFMNFRVADIQGVLRIVEKPGSRVPHAADSQKYGEIRCYIRDPDGYIIRGRTEHHELKYG